MKETFEKLIEAARAHEIDTGAAEFGFETRLLATLRDLNSETGFLDFFGNWLWKSTFVLAPIVAILMLFALVTNGPAIPHGTSNLVTYVVDSLPFYDPSLLGR